MTEQYSVATITKKAGLLLASDSRVTVLLGVNSTRKAIEITLGFAPCHFNPVTRAAINPE